MGKYRCKRCSYSFAPKGTITPKVCPACGAPASNLYKDYDAASLLEDCDKDSF
ncbi:MAG: hypothetical protein PHD81_04405 [Candidatus Nanoarchaeia archaeon]|nr:hypothetical protein [Candidatus Nanoarchaeia archaeon]MDD5588320.1 hypothetical protein [Candidatus Nanoarchaeia archaeon]